MAEAACPEYFVRLMKKEDIPQVLDILSDGGIQEGTQSVYTWFEVDPEGFYVAATEIGYVLGACSAVIHDDDMAFVGLWAIRGEYADQGIRKMIYKALSEHIGKRNVVTNSMVQINANPGKMELDSNELPIFDGDWVTKVVETGPADTSSLVDEIEGIDIKKLTDDLLPLAVEYDKAVTGYNREKAVTLTVHEEDSISYMALRDGECVGYGTMKVSLQGYGLVGPLYADSQEIAERLLLEIYGRLYGVDKIAMITVSNNEGARNIADKINIYFKGLDEIIPRFCKRRLPKIDHSKIFGMMSLNFTPY